MDNPTTVIDRATVAPMRSLENATVDTPADLEALWRRLMEPLGFAGRTLWMLLIRDDGAVFPELVQLDELPAAPTSDDADGLAHFVGHLVGEANHLRPAFLLSRPGRGGPDTRDRAWVEVVDRAVMRSGARREVVHVATDDTLAPVPLDDLDVRSA